MFQPNDLLEWAPAAKSALDLLKAASAFLPKGADKEAAEAKIKEAETILQRADAKLAQELGYSLCRCTFPPQIMLWDEARKADVCPACGHSIVRRSRQSPHSGGGSWMTA